ncbi:NAD/NADP octopine/nopaline dehydrogenase family protein [Streptomyces sp. NPDC055210]
MTGPVPARRVAVLGAGDAGRALAGLLAGSGHRVVVWNRGGDRADALEGHTVRLTLPDGAVTAVPLAGVSTDLAAACAGAEVVVLAVSSCAQPELVRRAWPLTRHALAVVLVPAHTGGVLAARHALGAAAAAGPVIAEMPLPFVCRGGAPGEVRVLQFKRDVPLAALPHEDLGDIAVLLAGTFPAVRRAAGLWETGLGNTTAVVQPALALAGLARIDRGERFGLYREGLSPAVGRLVSALDRERRLLAEALGLSLPSVVEWAHQVYGARGRTVEECLAGIPGYAGIPGPRTVHERFLTEHVRTGAVPMSELAAVVSSPHATLDALVELASAAVGTDLRATGRTLARMGLSGRSGLTALTGPAPAGQGAGARRGI